ncbi:hypothetical protein MtrunA17_Chr2g0283641 [Medicago truncatula]|uniref:Uncharacterized protein n=1 Tax=Medicago truncatula TaxID=3880 RepID=A0A396JA81_MEDTR|nr:hypothetical protein MtrunA17_Chr2g0283641 [Medicago truncatula]
MLIWCYLRLHRWFDQSVALLLFGGSVVADICGRFDVVQFQNPKGSVDFKNPKWSGVTNVLESSLDLGSYVYA